MADLLPPPGPTWIDRLGRTALGQHALFGAFAAAFLAAPDADLLLVGFLHHRSILTHSVLPALLVLWWGRGLGPGAAAGAALGVSVHMAADLLSPSVGFGQVWLPEPWQVPLGGWSRPWLGANAVAAAWLAFRLRARAGQVALGVAVAGAGAAAGGYGLVNEGSVAAVAAAGAVLAAGYGLHRARPGPTPGPALARPPGGH